VVILVKGLLVTRMYRGASANGALHEVINLCGNIEVELRNIEELRWNSTGNSTGNFSERRHSHPYMYGPYASEIINTCAVLGVCQVERATGILSGILYVHGTFIHIA
jgi:hypothetical protein